MIRSPKPRFRFTCALRRRVSTTRLPRISTGPSRPTPDPIPRSGVLRITLRSTPCETPCLVLAGMGSINKKEVLGTLGKGPEGVLLASVLDGLSNTILVGEGAGRPLVYVGRKACPRIRSPAIRRLELCSSRMDGDGLISIKASASMERAPKAFKTIRAAVAMSRSTDSAR